MSDQQLLAHRLTGILPGATLEVCELPMVPELQLQLLNADYPQGELTASQVQAVMDNPLYWVFCWASGQALSRLLLDEPHRVRGKRVLDFGSGSGVVAIAAALAGAAEVVACDLDPLARLATAENAAINGVRLEVADDFTGVEGAIDVILVADVLYDRQNLSWLDRFVERADRVLVADSRVRDFHHPPYRQVGRWQSCTIPDLDESQEFRDVRIYSAP